MSTKMLSRVGILKFEDRNRYGPNGIPSSVLFSGGKLLVVNCKSPHRRNHWAKLKVSVDFEDAPKNQSQKGELVELLGPVGDYAVERKALQLHFSILPCKYPTPATWELSTGAERFSLPEMGAPLATFLKSRGLGAYVDAFEEEAMDVETFLALETDQDFFDCSVKPGPDLIAMRTLRADIMLRMQGASSSSSSVQPPVQPVAESMDRVDCTHLASVTLSVDNKYTRDIDDALSFEFEYENCKVEGSSTSRLVRVGVHIADVASAIPCSSPLFRWAQDRASSAYHSGIDADNEDGHSDNDAHKSLDYSHGSIPMLPPDLAHGMLSLNQDEPRNAVTLWMVVDEDTGAIVHDYYAVDSTKATFPMAAKYKHERTVIVNGNATTYDALRAPDTATERGAFMWRVRNLLLKMSAVPDGTNDVGGCDFSSDPEDLVAWSMITYNTYFGELIAHNASQGGACITGLLRVQGAPKVAALYEHVGSSTGNGSDGDARKLGHASLGLRYYAHCSSPIRRFSDLLNQHAIFGTLDVQALVGAVHVDENRGVGSALAPSAMTLASAVKTLNKRCSTVARYHAMVDAMELAYRCRNRPMIFRGRVEIDGGGSPVGGVAGGSRLSAAAAKAESAGVFHHGYNDGRASLLVYTEKRRFRIPLHDSYFADSIEAIFPGATGSKEDAGDGGGAAMSAIQPFDGDVEIFGVLLAGRQRLRLRLPQLVEKQQRENRGAISSVGARLANASEESSKFSEPAAAALSPNSDSGGLAVTAEAGHGSRTGPHHNEKNGTFSADENECPLTASDVLAAGMDPALLFGTEAAVKTTTSAAVPAPNMLSGPLVDGPLAEALAGSACAGSQGGEGDGLELTEEATNAVLGYPIDKFQKDCLAVIVEPRMDLLAMAPTGSGKTAVALMAILQAFARGKKAIYTSPIKALSNQKYAEFKDWFHGRGVNADVSLLTGDVKIRAPPGTRNELLICTSEILRNKLVKASGEIDPTVSQFFPPAPDSLTAAPRSSSITGTGAVAAEDDDRVDGDLLRLGCVVSDEIHYINDVERGCVWEETLMHLPSDVQMVALSATLREPDKFLNWIGNARGRPGKLARRTDRHVPLHVGAISQVSNEFVEFYGTHGNRAGVFDAKKFHALFNEKPDAAATAAKQQAAATARAGRADEKAARAAINRGTGAPPKAASQGQNRGGGQGFAAKQDKRINFTHECTKLTRQLKALDKLPAVVFCMSRRKCVEGAHAIKGMNLLVGDRPKAEPDKEKDLEAWFAWSEEEKERQHIARTTEHARQVLVKRHLLRFMPELGELEAYHDIMNLLKRGIAYHHAGMLPILREFVELSFQARLVKLVFATETLAVGVNMPARTVVFTQLDKPNDLGEGHRWLRPDEFWQMAGRAGRRGMDVRGYVVYAPTLSVAGTKNMVDLQSLRLMMTGAMPAASSQLKIDKAFVLRHIARGHCRDVMETTLMADELERQKKAMLDSLSALDSGGPADGEGCSLAITEVMSGLIKEYIKVEGKLNGTDGDLGAGLQLRLNKKEESKLKRRLKDIVDASGCGSESFAAMKKIHTKQELLKSQIASNETEMASYWDNSVAWLQQKGFLKPDSSMPSSYLLLPRGRACAAFADGQPVVVGTVIADGYLEGMTFGEICAWISLFLRETKVKDCSKQGLELPTESEKLQKACRFSDTLLEQLTAELRFDRNDGNAYTYRDFLACYGQAEGLRLWNSSTVKQYGQTSPSVLDRNLGLLVLDWVEHKDIKRIAMWIEPSLLGTFVKSIMRIVSYVDMIREVALGLGQFEVHNCLDDHIDRLLGGLVTNASLYLNFD